MPIDIEQLIADVDEVTDGMVDYDKEASIIAEMTEDELRVYSPLQPRNKPDLAPSLDRLAYERMVYLTS